MKWVLVDANNLLHRCARALYSGTGTVPVDFTMYSVLDQLLSIGQDVKSNRFALFFDSATNRRKDIYPEYKSGRTKQLDRVYARAMSKIFAQLPPILKGIGFPIYECVGFEADDLIAKAAQWIDSTLCEHGIIISADSDLQQCISEYVEWYDFGRRKRFDYESFLATVGHPNDFVTVKAITGCTSDSVPGVPGVGPITAWKWVRGEPISTARTAAIRASMEIIDRNIKLVRLPMEGTPSFNLRIPQYNLKALTTIKDLNEAADLKEWEAFLRGRLSMEQMQKKRMRHVKHS